MPPSTTAPVEPRPGRVQVGVVVAATALVAVVLLADAQAAFGDGRAVGMVLAIAGAAVAAGTTYAFWGGAPVRTPRMHLALLAAMIGGASVAAAASSGTDRVFTSTLLGVVGLAGLAVGALALAFQRRTGTDAPTTGRRGHDGSARGPR